MKTIFYLMVVISGIVAITIQLISIFSGVDVLLYMLLFICTFPGFLLSCIYLSKVTKIIKTNINEKT